MALDARDFLSRHTLEKFAKPDKIITVSSEDTVLQAMEALVKADILCAPVEAPSPASDDFKDRYLGIVNVARLAQGMLDHLGHQGEGSSTGLQHLMALKHVQNAKLSSLSGSLGFDTSFQALDSKTDLLEACKVMGTMNVHRIPVLKDGKLCNFITQSAIVRVLVDNLESLPETANKTLKELHLAQPSNLVVVTRDMPTLSAFKLMKEKDLGALPIVDGSGHIIGNVSVRDLRGVITSQRLFEALHLPVTEFVAANVPDAVRSEMYPSITCTADDTLADVLTRLATTRIHRIYVVDPANKPIRVVTLSDVLAALVVPNAD